MGRHDSEEMWRVRLRWTARMSSTQIFRSVLQRPMQLLSDLELIPVFRPASPPRVILVRKRTGDLHESSGCENNFIRPSSCDIQAVHHCSMVFVIVNTKNTRTINWKEEHQFYTIKCCVVEVLLIVVMIVWALFASPVCRRQFPCEHERLGWNVLKAIHTL